MSDASNTDEPVEPLEQRELYKLGRHVGSEWETIAIEFLNYSIEEIDELKETKGGEINRVKFEIFNGWVKKNPDGNPRHVCYFSSLNSSMV